jgi:hypothetical protein
MAGNVAEWVNDWKGAYPKSESDDYAGARDPGPSREAPVKGGAFKYGLRELRPANRTATYVTIRSATAEYVGFRCALGPIAKPGYGSRDGNLSVTDPVRLEPVLPQTLAGGRAGKLVFVNATPDARHLVYVDYSGYPPSLTEFSDAGDVFHPSISPDGEWVAYCTAEEGTVSGSSLFVRRLDGKASPPIRIGPGFIPRWWIDPDSHETFLVYTTSASDDSQDRWNATLTLMRKWAGSTASDDIVALVPDGAFHDGRSLDGRWMATGFRLLKIHDGSNGSVRTLFTAPQNGKAPGDTSQVCNVSMAPDSTGRMLFLDFGYEGKSAVTGSFYDIHAVAFLGDAQGNVLRWFPAPAGERGWQDLEWSNRTGFAVSGAEDKAGGHGHLYLLDLTSGSATRMASGTWLTMPSLWLGEVPDSIAASGLDLDSLGHYNEPAVNYFQDVFSNKMSLFWQAHAGVQVLFTGSSHAQWGIDPRKITRYPSFNMGSASMGWLGQEEWIEAYALPHCPHLKVLVMEVFPGTLAAADGDYTWGTLSRTKGVRYDRSHGFWKAGLPAGFESLMKQSPNPMSITDSAGTDLMQSVGWGTEVFTPPNSEWTLEDPDYRANMARFEAFAKRISGLKIHLVLLNYPSNPAYKGSGYYSPYGPRMEVGKEILARIQSLEAISPYVHVYDAHNAGDHDYTDTDALDWGHLSATGAAKLTRRLDSLINTLP